VAAAGFGAEGTLIGLGVGAGLGYLLMAYACGEDKACQSWALVFGLGAAGAGIGAGSDALIAGKKVLVYSAGSAPSSARISVSPIVSPTRQGVVVRVSF